MDRIVDWTTKLWKIVDHNPGLAVAVVLCAVIMGCDGQSWFMGKTQSTLTGERSTAPQIKAAAESVLTELQSAQGAIGLRIEAAKRELETLLSVAGAELASVSDKIEATVARANEEIEAADVVTERNSGIIKTLLTFTGSAIPGLGPVLPVLLAGGLGLDNFRTKRVLKREKKKNGGATA